MCIFCRKRNLDGQPVVTDSVYFIRNPACSNYGNTQAKPAPTKKDQLLQVRSHDCAYSSPRMLCPCVLRLRGPLPGGSLLCCT